MEDYKPNSHKFKEEQNSAPVERKKVEKVTTGAVKTKKKSGLADAIISPDAKNVGSYIFMDVLVPAMKKALSDIVTDGIQMILYGETRRESRGNGSRVNYRRMYDRDRDYDRDYDRRYESSRYTNRSGYEDVIVESRGEAEAVLSQMEDILDAYKMVSVGDLYDLVGITTDNYTVNDYGWTSIRSADTVRVRDGWLIKLPKPLPIK